MLQAMVQAKVALFQGAEPSRGWAVAQAPGGGSL
jgi:hypothetical protein